MRIHLCAKKTKIMTLTILLYCLTILCHYQEYCISMRVMLLLRLVYKQRKAHADRWPFKWVKNRAFSKCWKGEAENRVFQDEWLGKYAFILPSSSCIRIRIRIRMSFIGQVCLHIRGICYSDRSSTVQQNDSNRTGHRQQYTNRQCTK